MSVLVRAAIVIVCIFLAIGCYAFGVPAGGPIFIGLGLLFEALIWVGVVGGKKKRG